MSSISIIHNVPGEVTFLGPPADITKLVEMLKGSGVAVQQSVTNCGCKPQPIPRQDWDSVYNGMSPLGTAPQKQVAVGNNGQPKPEPMQRPFDWASAFNADSPLGCK